MTKLNPYLKLFADYARLEHGMDFAEAQYEASDAYLAHKINENNLFIEVERVDDQFVVWVRRYDEAFDLNGEYKAGTANMQSVTYSIVKAAMDEFRDVLASAETFVPVDAEPKPEPVEWLLQVGQADAVETTKVVFKVGHKPGESTLISFGIPSEADPTSPSVTLFGVDITSDKATFGEWTPDGEWEEFARLDVSMWS